MKDDVNTTILYIVFTFHQTYCMNEMVCDEVEPDEFTIETAGGI